MSFIFVNVTYRGNWSDCNYEGGREMDISLSRDAITLYNLRYNISDMCNLFGTDFEIFYLKQSRIGQIIKSPLETEQQLLGCAMQNRWFNERRAAFRRENHPIIEEAMEKIALQIDLARTYGVMQRNTVEYMIHSSKRSLTVNLQAKECECMRWQLDCLPCAHAIAPIMDWREEVVDYVSAYYKRTTYANSYDLPILRVPHKIQWILHFSYKTPIFYPQ